MKYICEISLIEDLETGDVFVLNKQPETIY